MDRDASAGQLDLLIVEAEQDRSHRHLKDWLDHACGPRRGPVSGSYSENCLETSNASFHYRRPGILEPGLVQSI